MNQHAVPRQITTFEFKLIGFMTVKQFVYLSLFVAWGVVLVYTIPILYVNFIIGFIVGLFGVALAFFKYNERHLDVWIKNLFASLLAPSQYCYIKNNPVPDFLKDVFVYRDPAIAQTHVDAHKKLSNYIGTSNTKDGDVEKRNAITSLIHKTKTDPSVDQHVDRSDKTHGKRTGSPVNQPQPFLSGVVKNSKDATLPNIMLYINSDAGQTMRILKTNHHGVFATFHPLPSGDYSLNPKDLGATYFFDTINITIGNTPQGPIDIYSKEIL